MDKNEEQDIKTDFLQIRIREDVKEDIKIVAKLRKASVSALILTLIHKLIREAKAETPEAFPDYNPPLKIVNESGMDEILYEALDGKELTPEKRRAIEIAVRTALQVQEIEQGDDGKIK